MSPCRHTVQYRQLGDADQNGEITFADRTMVASGRLDAIGSSVVADGFVCGAHGELSAVIEVTRRTARSVEVEIRLARRPSGTRFRHEFVHTATVADVPLVTIPAGATSVIDQLRRVRDASERGALLRAMKEREAAAAASPPGRHTPSDSDSG